MLSTPGKKLPYAYESCLGPMVLKVTSSFACAEIVNKTINNTVHLAINTVTQYIMTAKQQHKDYSCLILNDLRPSESISLYSICAGTDHGMNANWTPSLSLSCFK